MMTRRRTFSRPPNKTFRGKRSSQRQTYEDTVRSAAAWVVERTLDSLSPSSVFLDSALAKCDPLDHGLLRELSLGCLRWLRRVDHVIVRAADRPLRKIDPKLHAPLRIAAYQLLFLDRIPPHAAVNEAVEQVRRLTHRGGVSFANAVLRRIARSRSLEAWPVEVEDPWQRLAIEQSHPDFLVRRWVSHLGEERTRRLVAANNRPKPLQLLTFRDRGGSEVLAEELIDQGIAVEPSTIAPLGLIVRRGNPLGGVAYGRGAFYLQDEASQAAALVPPPRPGERVLDAAAAPGGKTFSLLAVEPTIQPVMCDVAPSRMSRMAANLARLDRKLPLVVADAAQPAVRGTFDRVVLDLPCTGTGTLRKHPELKWRISEPEIGRLTRQSMRMLEGMAPHVAPDGFLIAITCSLEHEENEAVIEAFLAREPRFALEPLTDRLDYPLAGHVAGEGFWRIDPEGDHDGFTVHVLRRIR